MTPRTDASPRTTRRTNFHRADSRRASDSPTLARLREWFLATGLERTGTVTFTLITGATESRSRRPPQQRPDETARNHRQS